jgi:hypothetical protein
VKRLSLRAARRCELARTARCKCRCAGLLHGVARGEDPEFFRELPKEDPHYALPVPERKKRVLRKDRVPPLFEEIA